MFQGLKDCFSPSGPSGGAERLMEILQALWGGFLQSLFVGLTDVSGAEGLF